ncbi:MAG: sulfurtransferase [Anaerolineales bacterium]|nr:sulfurtransferase [Anaerolineales bacterium]
MPFTTIISCGTLNKHLKDPNWAIIDCRFSLNDVEYGRREYYKGHIPGSAYAHLDEDLSSRVIPGQTGRHPLPEISKFARRLSNWGIGDNIQVIAYDDLGGGIAARLWWLLRWLGHDSVALLDGGWQAWEQGGYPTEIEVQTLNSRKFTPRPRPELLVDADQVLEINHASEYVVVDSRAAERYRGEVEPIDPVAGHIPGAVNAPFVQNLDADNHFLDSAELKARFERILGDRPAEKAVFYCGSGVTAAHNLVALMHAGLGEGLLYGGSWSEWITDSKRPVEK